MFLFFLNPDLCWFIEPTDICYFSVFYFFIWTAMPISKWDYTPPKKKERNEKPNKQKGASQDK